MTDRDGRHGDDSHTYNSPWHEGGLGPSHLGLGRDDWEADGGNDGGGHHDEPADIVGPSSGSSSDYGASQPLPPPTLGTGSGSQWDGYLEEEKEGSASAWLLSRSHRVVELGRDLLRQLMEFLARHRSGQQRYPMVSMALTVIVVLVIHYRVELRQFWAYHREGEASIARALVSAAQELREILYACYAMCVVTPLRYLEVRLHELGQTMRQCRDGVRMYFFPKPMPDFVWDDEYDENGNPKMEEPSPAVGPNEGRWDDPRFLDPAFLIREQYPPDWNVYHQELGVVPKTEAEEYDVLVKKLHEQKEQLRRDGIHDEYFSNDGEDFVGDQTMEATKTAAAPAPTRDPNDRHREHLEDEKQEEK